VKSLTYSPGALDVLHKFHRSDVIAYVEGDEDIAFWSAILAKASIGGVALKKAGGVSQLDGKIQNIIRDGARIIVACDSDHSAFCAGSLSHVRVVRSYGYSIENTMYCPLTLNRTGQKVGRTAENMLPLIEEWYSRIEEACFDALVYDVANHRHKKGVSVFGDNCSRFLTRPTSPEISRSKVKSFLLTIGAQFTPEEIEEVRLMILADPRPNRMLVKGHFLTHAVNRLLTTLVKHYRTKKVIVSDEMLYGLTVDGCKSCDCGACRDLETLVASWKLALADVKT